MAVAGRASAVAELWQSKPTHKLRVIAINFLMEVGTARVQLSSHHPAIRRRPLSSELSALAVLTLLVLECELCRFPLLPLLDGVGAEVVFIALFGQLHLSLSFAEALALVAVGVADTVWTTHTRLVVCAGHIIGSNRHTTSVALFILPPVQLVIHGNAVVEDKAFAAP
jgi:hypothetical protein